jgi:pimeloyl-ACP methyl ester carboxylesterase
VLIRFVVLVLAAYALFAALVWFYAERLIFQPPAGPHPPSSTAVSIPRQDGGTLSAVHVRNPGARYTVLFSHGNAEHVWHNLDYFREMAAAGFSVLAYDYSGYGLSTGHPSERAAYADIDAAYDHLTRIEGVPPERIIAHGRSLGGAVAADLASRRPVAGLVLESTFTTIHGVVSGFPLVPFDRFRTWSKLPKVRAPVLVIHGTEDEVIAFAHGQRLYQRAPSPKRHYWVKGAGHNDLLWVAGDEYWRMLSNFAASLPAEEKQ